MSTKLINQEAISFNSIKEDLLLYVSSKPEAAKWLSKLESNIGTTVIELIAGLGVYKAFNEMVSRREGYLDEAQLETSIHELAFNRGFIVSPADAGEFLVTFNFQNQRIINSADLVGTFFDYNLYSIEDKVLTPPVDTLRCVAGWLEEFVTPVSTTPFSTLEFITRGEVASTALEKLYYERDPLKIEINLKDSADLDLSINIDSNSFVLRRWRRGLVKIYTGNGVLGWFNSVGNLRYRVLSYNPDIVEKAKTPSPQVSTVLANFVLSNIEVVRNPSDGMDKETIRNIAEFYPADGRIVRDVDYELIIKKYFSDKVHDVYSYNTDPIQVINIIQKPNFSDSDLLSIQNVVDFRRSMGMSIIYNRYTESQGKVLNFKFNIPENVFTESIKEKVEEYLNKRLFKFPHSRTPITINSIDLAVELSAEFGITFVPMTNVSYTLLSNEFIKEINVTYV